MPRPYKCRRVGAVPGTTYFKPRGVPMRDLTEVCLPVDGFEAVRLADYEGLKHEDAAQRMGVSRQTFGRILAAARRTLAESIVKGLALRVEGGLVEMAPPVGRAAGLPGIVDTTGSRSAGPDIGRTSGNRAATKEEHMAKIAVTSDGPHLDGRLDPRFGRAAGFMIVDSETMEFTYVDNGGSQAMAQGAGIQAAENVSRAGAQALLTGNVGPKAFAALSAAGIKVYQNLESLTVRQAVERFKKGELEAASEPNKQGHW